jgi:hypothetical protein
MEGDAVLFLQNCEDRRELDVDCGHLSSSSTHSPQPGHRGAALEVQDGTLKREDGAAPESWRIAPDQDLEQH